jgi:hypothetical protein
MIEQINVEALHLRGRAALATALARSSEDAARSSLLDAAERDARTLRRAKAAWANGLGELLRAGTRHARGDTTATRAHLGAAIAICEEQGMMLHTMAARAALGRLLPGEDGARLGAAAVEWAASQGIRQPARLFALVAPGLVA